MSEEEVIEILGEPTQKDSFILGGVESSTLIWDQKIVILCYFCRNQLVSKAIDINTTQQK